MLLEATTVKTLCGTLSRKSKEIRNPLSTYEVLKKWTNEHSVICLIPSVSWTKVYVSLHLQLCTPDSKTGIFIAQFFHVVFSLFLCVCPCVALACCHFLVSFSNAINYIWLVYFHRWRLSDVVWKLIRKDIDWAKFVSIFQSWPSSSWSFLFVRSFLPERYIFIFKQVEFIVAMQGSLQIPIAVDKKVILM